MKIITERKYTLLGAGFLFIATSTPKGSIKFVFIKSLEQALGFHDIGMKFTPMGKWSHPLFHTLLIFMNDEVNIIFRAEFIPEFDHLPELPM